ncbi:nucleotidyltransferase domain-containing protein [Methylothermus subterraneus]
MPAAKLPLDPRDAAAIQRLLQPWLERFKAQLILFGSRARGDFCPASDIDVAIKAESPLPPWLLAEMRELMENSPLPFKVDLIDYARAPEDLKRAIDAEGIPWPI